MQFQLSFSLAESASGGPELCTIPAGPYFPVPPSRGMRNNWAVSPGRHAKRKPQNQKVRRPLFPLFRWWPCSMATPKQHQAVLGSTQMRAQKPVPAIPTQWLGPWCNWLDHRSGNRYRPICPPSSFFSSSLVSDSRRYKRKPKRCVLAKKRRLASSYCMIRVL